MTYRLTARGRTVETHLKNTAWALLVLASITPGAIAVALYLTGGINP